MSSGRLLIVSDEHVARFYMDSLKQQLLEAGYQVASCVLEPGERSKRLSCVERIYEALYELRATRTDAVVALGGGVIGDMAGFAAATYQRGICLVQIPTSLMAQVDSSVGGKTAVDTDFGKNMVGAFYQPDLVLIDPETLSTLPPARIADGMAEVIKYGAFSTLLFRPTRCTGSSDLGHGFRRLAEHCCALRGA